MFRKVHTFRVKPGQDLHDEIVRYCNEHMIQSGIVMGIIGSLQKARLNFLMKLPGMYQGVDYTGPLEIVCAQGSIALNDDNTLIVHVHIQLSSQETSYGGHLVNGTIFSTAEVTIGELDYQLQRKLDTHTGLLELID